MVFVVACWSLFGVCWLLFVACWSLVVVCVMLCDVRWFTFVFVCFVVCRSLSSCVASCSLCVASCLLLFVA